jgi:hypothetical protein
MLDRLIVYQSEIDKAEQKMSQGRSRHCETIEVPGGPLQSVTALEPSTPATRRYPESGSASVTTRDLKFYDRRARRSVLHQETFGRRGSTSPLHRRCRQNQEPHQPRHEHCFAARIQSSRSREQISERYCCKHQACHYLDFHLLTAYSCFCTSPQTYFRRLWGSGLH